MNIYISSIDYIPNAEDTTENKHPRGHFGASQGMMIHTVRGRCWHPRPEAGVAAAQWRPIPTKLLPVEGSLHLCGRYRQQTSVARMGGRKAEGREGGRGNFWQWLMLCRKWSVVGSSKGREEHSCSYLHVTEAMLLQIGGGSGLREGLPEKVTWAETRMMRYSHYAKICGKSIPGRGNKIPGILNEIPHTCCV